MKIQEFCSKAKQIYSIVQQIDHITHKDDQNYGK